MVRKPFLCTNWGRARHWIVPEVSRAFLLASLLLPWLAGCQSRQTVAYLPSGFRNTRADYQPFRPAAVGALADVRQSELVKAYGVNRYVDPADSRLMHERHALYRLEEQPAWVTRSPRGQDGVLLGPVVGLRKPEYAPEPLPGETARELMQARRGLQEASQGVKAIQESEQKLATTVEALARQTAEAQRKLTTVVSALNERMKRLEGDDAEPVPTKDPSGVVVTEP
jgi:hypothetical protein